MGNSISHKQLHASATGKVILSDGSVHQFNKPLTVAELMLEHPQQVVVEFGAAVSEKRPTPLPADMKLDKKKIYLMLPMKRGKPVSLSSQEIHGYAQQAILDKLVLCQTRNLVRRGRRIRSTCHSLICRKIWTRDQNI
ncbi:uncharacterized protein LOC117637868 isoform X2 [Prunus dulcis]|uniref:uncharacterized protein LOC117637868 isoform X2 n=1 Tax=Prunus dulcis TaxID=3755 RepID=UPI00148387ED|nr:uncharacterized protein LOC117637868 isoform X2 [Prunus dulcis]